MSNRASASSCWLLLGALALGGCVAETGDEIASQDQSITDGVATSKYPSVGAIHNDASDGLCTGTVIAPRWVLTAGHCVLKTKDGTTATTADKLSYHEGKRVSFFWNSGIDVDAVYLHPNYGGGNKSDLALLYLSEESDGGEMRLGKSTPKKDWPVLLVGYGRTSEDGGGQRTKRAAKNTIGAVNATTLFFYGTGDGEGNICNGDSGGPTLIFRPNTGPEIIGVHSTKVGGCGAAGSDMRVDVFRGWIEDVTGLDF